MPAILENHIVVGQYVGDGVARFVLAVPDVLKKSSAMTNPKMFNRFSVGEFLKISIKVSGEKRFIIGAVSIAESVKDPQSALAWMGGEPSYIAKLSTRPEDIIFYMEFVPGIPLAVRIAPSKGDVPTTLKTLTSSIVGSSSVLWMPFIDGKLAIPKSTIDDIKRNSQNAFESPKVATVPAKKFFDYRLSEQDGNKVKLFGKSKIYVKRSHWEMISSLYETANARPDLPSAVLILGPSGWGKTSIPEAFAQEMGLQFLRVDCANVRDPEEWFGYREASEGSTIFVKSPLVNAIEAGNCVIVFDEVNRIEPWMTNTLFSLLDHAKRIVVHGLEIKVAKNVMVFATANIGGRFVGTFSLDAAFMNRFAAVLKVRALSFAQETEVLVQRTGIEKKIAEGVVKVAEAIRKFDETAEIGIDISLRTTLKICNLLNTSKIGALSIMDVCFLNMVDDDSTVKQMIDLIMPIMKENEFIA